MLALQKSFCAWLIHMCDKLESDPSLVSRFTEKKQGKVYTDLAHVMRCIRFTRASLSLLSVWIYKGVPTFQFIARAHTPIKTLLTFLMGDLSFMALGPLTQGRLTNTQRGFGLGPNLVDVEYMETILRELKSNEIISSIPGFIFRLGISSKLKAHVDISRVSTRIEFLDMMTRHQGFKTQKLTHIIGGLTEKTGATFNLTQNGIELDMSLQVAICAKFIDFKGDAPYFLVGDCPQWTNYLTTHSNQEAIVACMHKFDANLSRAAAIHIIVLCGEMVAMGKPLKLSACVPDEKGNIQWKGIHGAFGSKRASIRVTAIKPRVTPESSLTPEDAKKSTQLFVSVVFVLFGDSHGLDTMGVVALDTGATHNNLSNRLKHMYMEEGDYGAPFKRMLGDWTNNQKEKFLSLMYAHIVFNDACLLTSTLIVLMECLNHRAETRVGFSNLIETLRQILNNRSLATPKRMRVTTLAGRCAKKSKASDSSSRVMAFAKLSMFQTDWNQTVPGGDPIVQNVQLLIDCFYMLNINDADTDKARYCTGKQTPFVSFHNTDLARSIVTRWLKDISTPHMANPELAGELVYNEKENMMSLYSRFGTRLIRVSGPTYTECVQLIVDEIIIKNKIGQMSLTVKPVLSILDNSKLCENRCRGFLKGSNGWTIVVMSRGEVKKLRNSIFKSSRL